MPKKAGVMGWPISHSLSPALHGYWISLHRISAEYQAFAVEPANLATSLKALAGQGFSGVNLTVPHKEAALPLMDHLHETAEIIGAVNTVVVKEGKLLGSNTDAYGFMANLKEHHTFGRKDKAVVLGAGGAARAVVKALSDEGFEHIVIANRTPDKARLLARKFKSEAAPWLQRAELLEGAALLVNTTTLGMKGSDALDINLSLLPEDALVTDIVYTPLMTNLLTQAKARGNKVVDGLGMLLHQAVPCFEAWFGVRPKITDALRQHVLGRIA